MELPSFLKLIDDNNLSKNINVKDWSYNSVVENLPGTLEALGAIPRTSRERARMYMSKQLARMKISNRSHKVGCGM